MSAHSVGVPPTRGHSSVHILVRLAERVPSEADRSMILDACMQAARHYATGSHAVRMVKLASSQGTLDFRQDGTGTSNGNCGVLLIREGTPVTFLWRREAQPHTPSAYRVDKVHYNRGAR
jgi:hypothetical protein